MAGQDRSEVLLCRQARCIELARPTTTTSPTTEGASHSRPSLLSLTHTSGNSWQADAHRDVATKACPIMMHDPACTMQDEGACMHTMLRRTLLSRSRHILLPQQCIFLSSVTLLHPPPATRIDRCRRARQLIVTAPSTELPKKFSESLQKVSVSQSATHVGSSLH